MDRYFHSELDIIRGNLVKIGDGAVDMVELSLRALFEKDLALSHQVRAMDEAVDALEREIDREVLNYMALRNPLARDLRLLTIALKASHDLERTADEAKGIAKRSLRLAEDGFVDDYGHLPEMGRLAVKQIRDALQSFIDGNLQQARDILKKDEEIDRLNKENYKIFVERARAGNHVQAHIELITISNRVERIGDHATNLAEEVIFFLTGEMVD